MAGNEHERTTESRLDSLSERTNSCEPCCPLQVHQALDDDPDELESAPMADLPGNDQVAAELYKPIKDWQTRLLCLHSGSTTMIEVSLYTADLVHMKGAVVHMPSGTERIDYEALSYAWDHVKPDQKPYILCSGLAYAVSPSVYQVLTRLRSPQQSRYLWIDFLCINQYDIQEKDIQVTNMFSVYLKAKRIIAWLGEPSKDSYLALRAITTRTDVEPCSPHEARVQAGLRELYSRSWHRRTWVRQEIFTAADIIVQCGSRTVPWNLYKGALDTASFDDSVQWSLRAREAVESLKQAKPADLGDLHHGQKDEPTEKQSNLDLLKILRKCVVTEASDERDHIYGVLGMTNTTTLQKSGISPGILIDYGLSVSEVFQSITKYLIDRDGTIGILYLKGQYGSETGLPLPSWTLDWRQETMKYPFWVFHLYLLDRQKVRAKPMKLTLPKPVSNSLPMKLVLEGVMLGTILFNTRKLSPFQLRSQSEELHVGYQDPVDLSNNRYMGTRAANNPWRSILQAFLAYLTTKPRPKFAELKQCKHTSLPDALNRHDQKPSVNPSLEAPYGSRVWNLSGDTVQLLDERLEAWIVPHNACQDDALVVPVGGVLPLLLRPLGNATFQYIGPAIIEHTVDFYFRRFHVKEPLHFQLYNELQDLLRSKEKEGPFETFTLV